MKEKIFIAAAIATWLVTMGLLVWDGARDMAPERRWRTGAQGPADVIAVLPGRALAPWDRPLVRTPRSSWGVECGAGADGSIAYCDGGDCAVVGRCVGGILQRGS